MALSLRPTTWWCPPLPGRRLPWHRARVQESAAQDGGGQNLARVPDLRIRQAMDGMIRR